MSEMKFTKKRRENLGKVAFNLSQAIFIALIIGRIATQERISNTAFILGLILFLAFLFSGYVLDRGE